MDYKRDLKEKFEKELEGMSKSGKLSVDAAYKLIAIVYRLCKMEQMDESEGEYSRADGMSYGGMSYNDGDSYRRGRAANGRYVSRDDGMSRNRDGGDVYSNRRYSRHDGKDYMFERLGKMMKGASPEERETLEMTLEMLQDI